MRKNTKINDNWTTQESVVNLAKAGGSPGEIASRLGRSLPTVYNYLSAAYKDGTLEKPRRNRVKRTDTQGSRHIEKVPKNIKPLAVVVFRGKDLEALLSGLAKN